MKKLRILPIILLCIMGISTHSVWAYPESRHSSFGIKLVSSLHDVSDLANVGLPTGAFPNIIAQNWKPTYTVYGNALNNDTLTVGQMEHSYGDDYTPSAECLAAAVYDHIRYIESIGGKMTGYAEQNGDYGVVGWELGYVISWDVDGKHHYAKFGTTSFQWWLIGYYDLEFTDESDSPKYIPQLNETLSIISWSQ